MDRSSLHTRAWEAPSKETPSAATFRALNQPLLSRECRDVLVTDCLEFSLKVLTVSFCNSQAQHTTGGQFQVFNISDLQGVMQLCNTQLLGPITHGTCTPEWTRRAWWKNTLFSPLTQPTAQNVQQAHFFSRGFDLQAKNPESAIL